MISGIAIGVILAAMLLSPPIVTGIVLCVLSVMAYREVINAMASGKTGGGILHNPFEAVGYAGIIVLYLMLIVRGGKTTDYIPVIIAVFSINALIYVFRYPEYGFGEMVSGLFAFIYPAVMLSFIYMMRILPGGAYLAWVPFVAWICDTTAYFTGRAFGRHKLSPVLSPKKTVEGAIGGILGCMVMGVIFAFIWRPLLPDMEIAGIIAAMLIITAVAGGLSQIGDLLASGLKREHGIKDYGNIIPGHGGIMDRFDSVIFISPFVYFLALFLLYGGLV